jgi:hypothetical protein
MDRVDKDSLEYVLWCARIHVVDLLAQLRDDGEIPVVELVERLTKLLGLLQETEAKARLNTKPRSYQKPPQSP